MVGLRQHLGLRVVPTRQRYQQIVDRFEEIARANLGDPERISDICDAIAVSQRTLVRAFHAVHGTSPSRYLHALRLAEARKALKNGAFENVTEVAVRFGFHELGRFAVDYRAAFGESPSDTLRHCREAACG
jgi:transcriptional regulator GlxA family with amidase domain